MANDSCRHPTTKPKHILNLPFPISDISGVKWPMIIVEVTATKPKQIPTLPLPVPKHTMKRNVIVAV
jgi:hypothetical protein